MRARTAIGIGVLATAAIGLTPAAAAASTPAAAGGAAGPVLYVAPKGSDSNACTRTAPCATIQHAVNVAHAGATVQVAPGTYKETVSITTRIRLIASGRGVVIDATGHVNGIALGVDLSVPKTVGNASGSLVAGFTIKNATQEGIVAVGSHLALVNNVVTHNDLGATMKPPPPGECAGEGEIPGDCGEGVHLAGVTYSLLASNSVTGNQGGMLISDEFGPTAHNLIAHNNVSRNVPDCGVTLAAHNGQAVSNGVRQPGRGGVYRNAIIGNVVNANGAAGVGFFAGGPGTGSYENLAALNSISGNGIPGVAIHTHTPNSDTNGNRIVGNFLSRNGLGEGGKPPQGDPETPVTKTTNIDVVADPGATPITGTLIAVNKITNVQVGIWLVTRGHTDIHGNRFVNVAIPVKRTAQK
ncbi:MAG: right-handed parallel beta-helix repeat-containing protein [Frankiaceae bacterium]